MKIFLWYVLQFTWGIMQNIVGGAIFIILKLLGKKCRIWRGCIITEWDMQGSYMSLGVFLFGFNISETNNIFIHERGHSIQSVIVGPLYLLIIGLPSILWCSFGKYGGTTGIKYGDFYTEGWADYLGTKYYNK